MHRKAFIDKPSVEATQPLAKAANLSAGVTQRVVEVAQRVAKATRSIA